MQDTIAKEITVKASAQRVYEAITDPTQIIKWFPDAVEGDLAAGQKATFTFEGHGKSSIYTIAATPFNYFAYRWIPGGAVAVDDVLKESNTLVEFFIEERDGKTNVTVKESGFALLPVEMAEKAFAQNSGGWDYMLERLEKFAS